MINKEEFVDVINTVRAYNTELDKWEAFGISLYELPLGEISAKLSEMVYTNLFEDAGIDWINWWLYEKPELFEGDPVNEAYDENHNIIPTDTIDDLWNLVKDYRK
jgi:hypothetical protein